MLDRIYLEITNVCNLDCTFCHKTARQKKLLSREEFDLLLEKIEGRAKHLYFHLMGEPTLHPLLPQFIEAAREKGFLRLKHFTPKRRAFRIGFLVKAKMRILG